MYRPHKHSTVKSKHSKRYATKKHTRRNKGRYQGGNSVPNPPLASVSIYEAPIQAYEFQKPTQSHNRSQNQSQSHNRLNDNLAHDCWKPEFLFRPGCGGSEQSSGTPGRTGGGSDIR
ncbi:MAG: hypothetical protein IJ566_01545 [Cardiobacteriaceae bacterium]|nr:hypothetical protein [Cardiobacteriaceae bacterium]